MLTPKLQLVAHVLTGAIVLFQELSRYNAPGGTVTCSHPDRISAPYTAASRFRDRQPPLPLSNTHFARSWIRPLQASVTLHNSQGTSTRVSILNASMRPSPQTAPLGMAGNGMRQKTSHSNSNGAQSTKLPIPLSSLTNAPLDLASVERRGQPNACPEPVKRKSRPHGLQEAPSYRPTEEEWKEPFEYIKKISAEARQYGLCKIIPPDSWNPDFAIDTEVGGVSQICRDMVGPQVELTLGCP